MTNIIDKFVEAGIQITPSSNGSIKVRRASSIIKPLTISTEPFPGFPTDMQAQFMAMMTIADGVSLISESIFENRFMHVPELARMGADIELRENTARIRGVMKLSGAEVMATDLRASVSLVLAGLVASGETVVNRVYHLERGYERIEEKLNSCGAQIRALHE